MCASDRAAANIFLAALFSFVHSVPICRGAAGRNAVHVLCTVTCNCVVAIDDGYSSIARDTHLLRQRVYNAGQYYWR